MTTKETIDSIAKAWRKRVQRAGMDHIQADVQNRRGQMPHHPGEEGVWSLGDCEGDFDDIHTLTKDCGTLRIEINSGCHVFGEAAE